MSDHPVSEDPILKIKNLENQVKKLQKKDRAQMYLDIAGVIMIVLNTDQTVALINKKGAEVLGYDARDIVGQKWFDRFIPENDREKTRQVFLDLMAGQMDLAEYFENQVLTKGGRKRLIAWHNSLLTDKSGQITGTLSSGEDITERRRVEEELRQIFTMSLDLICIADINTAKFTKINPSFIRTLGYSEEELLGRTFLDFIHPDDVEPTKRIVEEKLRKGQKVIRFPNRYRCKDGDYRWLSWTSHPNPKAGITYAVARDITDLKEAEQNRRKLEIRLRQAQKLESVGALAGGIAHDFNNILSSVIGFAELGLDEVKENTVLEEHLLEIFSAGKRARELVKQILTFARQADEKIKPVQVSLIAKEALKLIRSSIPTSIEIRQNIQSDSMIMGDPTQVHQIFMNLCTNAAHAMEDRGGRLNIGLEDIHLELDFTEKYLDFNPGDYMKITVSDTGKGIPADIIDLIFEPYFTTKEPGEGTGMGLAVIHGIVKTYGGEITVESKAGKGSLFTVYLPVTKKRYEQQAYQPKALPIGSERILFIDDESAIVRMGGKMLERLGYKVTTRTSSIEALGLFEAKTNDFDLVITDMTMPNMTGDELTSEMLKIRPDIPVILCTGYSKKITDETANRIGIKALVYKPIIRDELANAVRRVLDEAK